jgi:hypothetical protein
MAALFLLKSILFAFIIPYREIESTLGIKKETLKKTFIGRVLAFSISGTYIVDLKDNS